MKHQIHAEHNHEHGSECGHQALKHNGHIDYLHDGHLHHKHEDHWDECVIEVSEANPATCTSGHSCEGHDADHTHGPGCGHEPVPHGDHIDYLVNGHLHHPHGDHCDNHGKVELV
jgi:hypothetical protein